MIPYLSTETHKNHTLFSWGSTYPSTITAKRFWRWFTCFSMEFAANWQYTLINKIFPPLLLNKVEVLNMCKITWKVFDLWHPTLSRGEGEVSQMFWPGFWLTYWITPQGIDTSTGPNGGSTVIVLLLLLLLLLLYNYNQHYHKFWHAFKQQC